MQSSIQMIIEEVKRLSNIYENKIPSALLFETLFIAEEIHKQEIIQCCHDNFTACCSNELSTKSAESYYNCVFKKD